MTCLFIAVGSDGILLGPLESKTCDFGLRIFNPDGSEAEKSGNGLRIFARSVWDNELKGCEPFTVETPGGVVLCEVLANGNNVKVGMGEVSFDGAIIPVNGISGEVLNEKLEIDDHVFKYCAATIGNPHCVVFSEGPTREETCRYGPVIEVNQLFPNRTNVQFMRVIDSHNIQIEIWERGAGYTLASGSSSTASAAVAHRLGFCESDVTVHMPGGTLQVQFDEYFFATMTGPVTKICEGKIEKECISYTK